MNLTRAAYATRARKVGDFLIGYFGWFVLNALLQGVLFGVSYAVLQGAAANARAYPDLQNLVMWATLICNALLLVLNVALVVYFALTRYWIALGALAAFATLLVLTICAAIFLSVACFASLAGYGSTP